MIAKTCLNCKNEFHTRRKDKVYCSDACQYEANKAKVLARYHAGRGATPERCVVCGGALPTKHRRRKYCSDECRWGGSKKQIPKSPIVCGNCGDVFIGYRREKYCDNCKQKRPSLGLAVRTYLQRLRAKALGLPASFGSRDWRRALNHFGNRCAYCGGEGELEIEHFIPVALGGGTTKNNIVPACHSCNNRKGDKHPADWLPVNKYREIQRFLNV